MKIKKISSVVALSMIFCSPLTYASSPDAWQALDNLGKAACLHASNLSKPSVVGPIVHFDDLGMSVVMVHGRYPQRHMNNKPGKELCLFDKKSKKAAVAEAVGFK
jgi:hypothetical protein